MILKDIEIEELVRKYPFSVRYLMEKGIRCLACGEPIWGTLEEAAKEKGFKDTDIYHFVEEMNSLASKEDAADKDKQVKFQPNNLTL